ncbi:endonuclease [Formosa sp. S-31]|uniref:endonuclease/exonuclease/phosphatase family protein n=1 Tax=Formosa sp. S-31 TaxID=2790949 RepID=UPI003EBA5141
MKTVSFFNVENLFDTFNDPHTNDDDFLPTSDKRWTEKRYENKLFKLGLAISSIGKMETETHPAIVGLAEIENNTVLTNLLESEHLNDLPYDYVHFDSSDERGIDVALIYDTTVFTVIHSEPFSIQLFDEYGSQDYTRDILLVSGLFDGEPMHFLVNHWPSKHEASNAGKRLIVSNKVSQIITGLNDNNPGSKIIVMGDFNDDSDSKGIQTLVNNNALFNPMETLKSTDRGSVSYREGWDLFDQFMLSHNFLEHKAGHHKFDSADIFDADFLKQYRGHYAGQPFRTYAGNKYKGGYSDHFPVYLLLRKITGF